MKYFLLICLFAVLLCACEPADESFVSADESSEPIESKTVSEATATVCAHEYGNGPIETIGNIDIYECQNCGERKAVANGAEIGGE